MLKLLLVRILTYYLLFPISYGEENFVFVKTGKLDNGQPYEEEDTVGIDPQTGVKTLQKIVRMKVNVHVHKNPLQEVMPMMMDEPLIGEEQVESTPMGSDIDEISKSIQIAMDNLARKVPEDSADLESLRLGIEQLQLIAQKCMSQQMTDSGDEDERPRHHLVLHAPASSGETQQEDGVPEEQAIASESGEGSADDIDATQSEEQQDSIPDEETVAAESNEASADISDAIQQEEQSEHTQPEHHESNHHVVHIIGDTKQDQQGNMASAEPQKDEIQTLQDEFQSIVESEQDQHDEREEITDPEPEPLESSLSSSSSSESGDQDSQSSDSSEGGKHTIQLSIDTKDKATVTNMKVKQIDDGKETEIGESSSDSADGPHVDQAQIDEQTKEEEEIQKELEQLQQILNNHDISKEQKEIEKIQDALENLQHHSAEIDQN